MARRFFAATPHALAVSCSLMFAAAASGGSIELPTASKLACGSARDVRDIRLHIVNEAGAPPETIEMAMQEARAIWARAGVRLTFSFPPEPFALNERQQTVLVMIRQGLSPAAGKLAAVKGKVRRPLGWLVFDGEGQPGRLIELSLEAVTGLVWRGSYLDRPFKALPDVGRATIVGRGLGRVLAHELGHWLMGRGHVEKGLMKRSFNTRDLTEGAPLQLPCDWPAAARR